MEYSKLKVQPMRKLQLLLCINQLAEYIWRNFGRIKKQNKDTKNTKTKNNKKTILRARNAPSRSPILRATLKNTGRIASFPPPLSTISQREDDNFVDTRKKHDATRPVKRRAVATGAYFYRARARRERERTSFLLYRAPSCVSLCFVAEK